MMITAITASTAVTTTPTIMPTGDYDDDDDVGLEGTSITQSLELNESSIVGQSGSTSRMTPSTLILGLVCTHWFILVTMLSAAVIDVGTSKVIIARYTTVFLNCPWDSLQLKASSMMLLKVNSHEQSINTWLVTSSLISLSFWSRLNSYI